MLFVSVEGRYYEGLEVCEFDAGGGGGVVRDMNEGLNFRIREPIGAF